MKKGRHRKAGPRETNGRSQRQTRADREEAMRAQVEARSRALGIWPKPPIRAWGETLDGFEARKRAHEEMIRACAVTVGLPWMGCNAGRAIAGFDDVADLWQVIQIIRQRRAAYLVAIGACSDHAGIARLGVAPSIGDPEEEVHRDMRSEDERTEDALEEWAEIDDLLTVSERRVIYDVVILDGTSIVAVTPILRQVGKALGLFSDMGRKTVVSGRQEARV